MKIDNDCLRTSGNSTFKEKVTEFLNFLSESEENKQLPSEQILNLFEKHIVQSAKDVTKRETKHHPDWFSQSEKSLLLHIELRNEAFKRQTKNPTDTNNQLLKDARNLLQREKSRAKQNGNSTSHLNANVKTVKQIQVMPGR